MPWGQIRSGGWRCTRPCRQRSSLRQQYEGGGLKGERQGQAARGRRGPCRLLGPALDGDAPEQARGPVRTQRLTVVAAHEVPRLGEPPLRQRRQPAGAVRGGGGQGWRAGRGEVACGVGFGRAVPARAPRLPRAGRGGRRGRAEASHLWGQTSSRTDQPLGDLASAKATRRAPSSCRACGRSALRHSTAATGYHWRCQSKGSAAAGSGAGAAAGAADGGAGGASSTGARGWSG